MKQPLYKDSCILGKLIQYKRKTADHNHKQYKLWQSLIKTFTRSTCNNFVYVDLHIFPDKTLNCGKKSFRKTFLQIYFK